MDIDSSNGRLDVMRIVYRNRVFSDNEEKRDWDRVELELFCVCFEGNFGFQFRMKNILVENVGIKVGKWCYIQGIVNSLVWYLEWLEMFVEQMFEINIVFVYFSFFKVVLFDFRW